MKTLIALFAQKKSTHYNDCIFDGKSAFERAMEWASSFEDSCVFVAPMDKDFTVHTLLLSIAEKASEVNAQRVMFAGADEPFLNKKLADEILCTHEKYCAEYTFADGYPEGLAPEVIDSGALKLLCTLSASDGAQSAAGSREAGRDAIFSVMRGDINAFEIETVIAPRDFRQYRLRFACDNKANTLACKRLYSAIAGEEDAAKIAEIAIATSGVLRSLPAYYRVQLTEKVEANDLFTLYPHIYKKMRGDFPLEHTLKGQARDMDFARFEHLVDEIASFSESAVVSLSLGGEPLLYPRFEETVKCVLSHSALSVLLETSGYGVTEEIAKRVADMGSDRVIWIVSVDATSDEMYKTLHAGCKEDSFSRAIAAVGILLKYFKGNVYPQFLRVNENEEQLESFFRFWKKGGSPSGGNVLIQKYDWGCGFLKENKPADLSPLERMPCWHKRRDFIVLVDGVVPLCQEYQGEEDFVGNVFETSLAEIWDKSDCRCSEKCSACDEYYTFNF